MTIRVASIERVAEDRNRITGAGIDFALVLAAKMRDIEFARIQQLAYEYDPRPPFMSGSPELAGLELTGQVLASYGPLHSQIKAAATSQQKRVA